MAPAFICTGSFVLLQLLLPTLLLCCSGGTSPVCSPGAVGCDLGLQDLFERVTILSHQSYRLSSEMYTEFHEVLLDLVVKVLSAWDDALNHLPMQVRNAPELTGGILSKASWVEENNKQIMEGLEKIIYQINPEARRDEDYALWFGLSTLQMENKDNRIFLLYNLFRCLHRDSHKVDTL